MTMIDKKLIAEAIKEALTDDSPHGWILLQRVPIICNDVKWIKRAIFGIFATMGSLLVIFLAK